MKNNQGEDNIKRKNTRRRNSKMSTKEKVDEWLAISREDVEVATLCFKNSKYLHCAFMCQQAVEKVLKALITASGDLPNPIHDLYTLAEDADIDEALSVEQKFF